MGTCSIIGKTNFKAITREFIGISRGKNHITSNTSRYNLSNYVLVGLWTKLKKQSVQNLGFKHINRTFLQKQSSRVLIMCLNFENIKNSIEKPK